MTRSRFARRLWLLAALSVGACGTPPAAIDTVILVSIDSLRADHVGAYGYPHPTTPFIDALARDGVVFERAYSTSSWTLPSHVAMLTGLDDLAHGVCDHDVTIPATVELLAETLSRQGIAATGFFSGPYLHPTFGFGRGFGEYVNCTSVIPAGAARLTVREHEAASAAVTNPILLARLREWVARRAPQQRNFVFLHMWDVHYDYRPPVRYEKLFDPDYRGTLTGEMAHKDRMRPGMDPRDLQHLLALYDGEIRSTDETIREMFDVLRGAGLLERAAVIITADHGEEFLEHGDVGHQRTLYEEVLRIPLIVHLPGRARAQPRIGRIVSLIDIYPTICGLFGVRCPNERYGENLMRLFEHGDGVAARDDAFAELSRKLIGWGQIALVTSQGKLHRWPDVRRLPAQQTVFFDTAALRDERSGVDLEGEMAGHPEPLRQMVARMEARLAAARAEGERLRVHQHQGAPSLDEKTRESLRALGYVE